MPGMPSRTTSLPGNWENRKPSGALVNCVQRFFTFGDLREDAFDRGAPHEDARILVVAADVIFDHAGQFLHVVERAAAQALRGQIAKPTFDQIEPGTGGGSEVQVKAWMAPQPTRHIRMRELQVDPKVVADQLGHSLDVNLNVSTQTGLVQRKEALNTPESALRVN